MSDPSPDISILTAATLFPNSQQASHGIFVETRLRHLVSSGKVKAHVLAPVTWAPPFLPAFRKIRQVPDQELLPEGSQIDIRGTMLKRILFVALIALQGAAVVSVASASQATPGIGIVRIPPKRF